MSWSRRSLLIALGSAPLCGCGFHPLYGGRAGGEYDPDLAAIKVSPIGERTGQILAMDLREKLNPRGIDTRVLYLLEVHLTVSTNNLGIQRDATTTRGEVDAHADYQLRPASGPSKIVYVDRSRAVSSFNVLTDGYATMVAADDARDRALKDLAEDMLIKLQLYVKRQREALG